MLIKPWDTTKSLYVVLKYIFTVLKWNEENPPSIDNIFDFPADAKPHRGRGHKATCPAGKTRVNDKDSIDFHIFYIGNICLKPREQVPQRSTNLASMLMRFRAETWTELHAGILFLSLSYSMVGDMHFIFLLAQGFTVNQIITSQKMCEWWIKDIHMEPCTFK